MYSWFDNRTGKPVYTESRAEAYVAFVQRERVYKNGTLMEWFGVND